jgi:hypothetical protein
VVLTAVRTVAALKANKDAYPRSSKSTDSVDNAPLSNHRPIQRVNKIDRVGKVATETATTGWHRGVLDWDIEKLPSDLFRVGASSS